MSTTKITNAANCETGRNQENPTHPEKSAFANLPRIWSVNSPARAALVVNADDWGRDQRTTNHILDCVLCRSVSSVSAMVFMEDTERAAQLAKEHKVDAGLHLNLSLTFSSPACPSKLREEQRKLVVYLTRHPLARVLFNPWLENSFEYVVRTQLAEFARVFGGPAERIDGHHHLHLCANVQRKRLLPEGTIVRRNFSFSPGEKSLLNRFYRNAVDRRLAKRHRIVDYLFALSPLEPRERLERISRLARTNMIEVETHPVNPDEFKFLAAGGVFQWAGDVQIARGFSFPFRGEKFEH